MSTPMLKLKEIRTAHNLSQTQLAEKIGVKPHTVSQWESGARTPDILTVNNIAKVLDCSIDDLIMKGGDDSNASNK